MDESGTPKDQCMVVGGVLVHEHLAWPLAQAADELADAVPYPARGQEIHTDHIRTGKKTWRGVPAKVREETLAHIANLLTDERWRRGGYPPVLFAVAMAKSSMEESRARGRDPIERLYEEFFARCNAYMRRLAQDGDSHRCLPILDESGKIEERLQTLMQIWRVRGATTSARIDRPLAGFADVPVFVDSRATRLIQLADFVCHTVYRHYITGYETREFKQILQGFDRQGDQLHGLTHLTWGYYDCACPACASRRQRRQRSTDGSRTGQRW